MNMHSRMLAITLLVLSAANCKAVTIDSTTLGSWVGVYGSQGYILNAFNGGTDVASLPAYVSGYSYSGNALSFVWAPNTSVVKAVDNPSGPVPDRVAATTYTNSGSGPVTVTLNLTQPATFQLGIYSLDWDDQNRVNDITVPGSGTVNVPYQTTGIWALFNVNAPAGPFSFTYDQAGGGNATISAITFDAAVPEPSTVALSGLAIAGGLCLRRRFRGSKENRAQVALA